MDERAAATAEQGLTPGGRRRRLAAAHLYAIVEARPHGVAAADLLAPALAAGVDVVQLRDKEASDQEIAAAARSLRALCDRHAALLIVNDRPELAAACAADGVHVGQGDATPDEARARLGPGALIGLSTHSPEQIEAALARDVDYIAVGPVHATPTKPGRAPVGLELVRHAATHADMPFFAIGGIDPGNVDAVAAAGATRVAVVRAIRDAPDPAAAARALRAALTLPRGAGAGTAA
jgi:thiamine-phosphate pyrophosphorylase